MTKPRAIRSPFVAPAPLGCVSSPQIAADA